MGASFLEKSTLNIVTYSVVCALLLRLLWFIYVFTVFLCHHDHRLCCRHHHQEVCAQLTFLHAQTFIMYPYIASLDFLFFLH